LTRTWRKNMDVGTIAITLGSNGIFIQNEEQGQGMHVRPDRAIDVVDVCGAGDAVICSLALSIMADFGLPESGALANLSGAFVCSHSGVVTARPEEIMGWI
ncbi:MAG: PfkB family carbohydrate kinase, partial [Saprospiraceae bacterium]